MSLRIRRGLYQHEQYQERLSELSLEINSIKVIPNEHDKALKRVGLVIKGP